MVKGHNPGCRHAAGGTGNELGFTKAGIIARKSKAHRANRGHVHKVAATTTCLGYGRESSPVCRYAAGGTDRAVGSTEAESIAKDEDPSSKPWARP